MNYGRRIYQLRKTRNLSQAELAHGIMSRGNLSNFEHDYYIPSFDKVIALLDRMNITITEFLDLENSESAYNRYEEKLILVENEGSLPQLIDLAKEIEAIYKKNGCFKDLFYAVQYLLHQYHQGTTLSLEEIKAEIKPKLFQTDYWYSYEHRLYNNYFHLFDLAENRILYARVQQKIKYNDVPLSSRYSVHLATNLAIQLIENRKNMEAYHLIQQTKKRARSKNLLNSLMTLNYLESLINHSADDYLKKIAALEIPDLTASIKKIKLRLE